MIWLHIGEVETDGSMETYHILFLCFFKINRCWNNYIEIGLINNY